MSDILGYPESEIVVSDITEDEKELWTVPTIVERRDGTPLISPDVLLAAYKIVGRKPSTFVPIQVWIVKEGTFLNDEVRHLLEQFSLERTILVVEGGRGPFGPTSFIGLGEGGIYPGKVKGADVFQSRVLVPIHEKKVIWGLYTSLSADRLRACWSCRRGIGEAVSCCEAMNTASPTLLIGL